MADTKISLLTEVTAPVSTDVLPIVNSSTTKKVQAANLLTAILPDQTSASGKVLQSNGTTASWQTPSSGSGDIKSDGSVDFTGIQAYDAHKTFTVDTDIIDKKYVDDAITASGGYTDEQAQDAVGGILTDTATIDFTYNDAGGQITADVKDGSITLAKQASMATASVVYRKTAGTGAPEVQTLATLKTDLAVSKSDVGLGSVDNVQQMPLSYLDTTITLGTSDVKVPSQKAVKTYADSLIAANDAMVYKGVIDCSTNPNYPAADAGHVYKVSVAGKIGGALGPNVEVNDNLLCTVDGSSSGIQAVVGSNWDIIQANVDGAVIGPASVTDSRLAAFDGTTGKLIKDSTKSISDFKATGADETANVSAASTTAQGKIEIAIGSEVTTGTDDTRAISPKALKDAGITADTHDVTYTSPGSNTTGSGIKTSLTAGETTTFGQVAYIKSDGKAWLAKADATTTMPGCVLAMGSISADAAGSYMVRGIARNDSWTWTVGGLIYISSATAGLLTQTAPTGTGKQVQVVGVALSATTIMFMPNMMLLELA